MTKVYFFGAGASFGSGPCSPSNPPLGGELFHRFKPYSKVLSELPAEVAGAFGHFEDGMAELTRRIPGKRAELLREMATYFLQFDPKPGNHYRKLIRHLRAQNDDIVFATLNYDMLIELAATDEGYDRIAYDTTDNVGVFRLLKLHGSPNFLPDLQGSTLVDIKWGSSARHLNAPVIAASWPDATKFWRLPQSIAPSMSLYSAGKEVLFSDRFVAKQQQSWAELCSSADEINIIGIRVWPADTHVWRPLSETSATVRYVGLEPDMFRKWTKARRAKSEVVATNFRDYVAKMIVGDDA